MDKEVFRNAWVYKPTFKCPIILQVKVGEIGWF